MTTAQARGAAIHLQDVDVHAGLRSLLVVPKLRIEAGERVAIVGPNGAGKTTLLRVMAGLLTPTQGQVHILGRELGPRARTPMSTVQRRALRQATGVVMQGLHLVPRLSARDNVLTGALARLQWRDAWRGWLRCFPGPLQAEADAALERLGLAERGHTRADRLSGGERQKVSLARLQLQRPRLVLADEPTSALDPVAVQQVCAVLCETAAEGALVTVLHQRDLLPLLATRVIGMAGGHIVWDKPLHAVDATLMQNLYQRASTPCPTP